MSRRKQINKSLDTTRTPAKTYNSSKCPRRISIYWPIYGICCDIFGNYKNNSFFFKAKSRIPL